MRWMFYYYFVSCASNSGEFGEESWSGKKFGFLESFFFCGKCGENKMAC